MANDFVKPEVVIKSITAIIKKAAKDNGVPPEREGELATAILGGLFKEPKEKRQ